MKIEDTSPLCVAGPCTAALLALLVGALVGFVMWYRWDSGENHGHRFGYFGEFNAISNAVGSLPGITIIGSGYNADVTLEELGFTVLTDHGREMKIWFAENDPVRKMSGSQLTTALLQRIAWESSNQVRPGTAEGHMDASFGIP